MAKILINDKQECYGKFTIKRTMDPATKKVYIEGVLQTHFYIEELLQLESDRYLIKNINVISESFGSDDFEILYSFTAESIDIKGGLSNLIAKIFKKMTSKLYRGDGSARRI